MLKSLPNKQGNIFYAFGYGLIRATTTTSNVLDAAGESRFAIGRVNLEAGSGSKTISAAGGGKIHWRSGSVTFADAGTTLRVGIQDVASTGLESETFDVYKDLVGGTDTISSNSDIETAMGEGTKTISHGDLIAVGMEMTERGGSDTVVILRNTTETPSMNFPYQTFDTGSGPTRSGVISNSQIVIEFDDGTIGWIDWTFYGTMFPQSFNSNSTPDERALIFQVPFKCSLIGVFAVVGSTTSTADWEIILYSDPLGTPSAQRTVVVDNDLTGQSTSTQHTVKFASFTLEPNTNYAIAVRPTTTTSVSLVHNTFPSGLSKFRKIFPFGESASLGTRTNQSGAFSTDTERIPAIGLIIDQLDDGGPTKEEIAQATWEFEPRTLT